jgi:hypothetical protein
MAKKTIEFFSSIKGVSETFPIRLAKDVIPPWTNEARKDFFVQQKNLGNNLQHHITKCPGIFHLFATGYIVSAWHDVEIIPIRNGFKYNIPDEMVNTLLEKPTIGSQGADTVGKFIPKRPWSDPSILKINTPWHILAPKGLKFLMIPIPYTDYFDFESCIGILDPSFSSEINVQGYWNKKTGSTTIKAGTPIAQLIPLSEKTYDFVVRDKNEKDEQWLQKFKYFNNMAFQYARNLIKKAYNKHVD